MMIECPHCHMETEHKVIDHINIDRNPELRAKVQDLSVFRVKCPNCGETVLAVHPCLYHDMANQFMVWLWTEDGQVPKAEFDPLFFSRNRLIFLRQGNHTFYIYKRRASLRGRPVARNLETATTSRRRNCFASGRSHRNSATRPCPRIPWPKRLPWPALPSWAASAERRR